MPHALIIDDEPGIRFALKRWFERAQWSVEEAGDGQAALDLLRAHAASATPVDLVVCDLHLPGISGEAIVATLRTEQPALVDRVILTTGDSVHDAAPGSVLASHPHVLQKPFDLATLKATVAGIVG